MKYKLLPIVLFSVCFNAQIKKLNDPSIVAQYKRMVYQSWGDFRPNPKYFLGVQTNFAYATVWGWLSPSINKDYKNGNDIRPLKVNGNEVQSLVSLKLEESKSEEIQKQVDSLQQRNIQDFAHWTSATVGVDPLWLLYYKTMLRPLNDFPDNPQNYIEWGIKDQETYSLMSKMGGIAKLQKELDLLKYKYKISRTIDMPRGKRFLLYNDTLIGWRKFIYFLSASDEKYSLFSEYKKLLNQVKNGSKPNALRTDKQIAEGVMAQYKNKF